MKKMSFAVLTLTAAASISFAADTVATKKVAPKKVVTAKKVAAASKVIRATVPVAPKANFDFLPAVVAEANGKKLTKAELIKKLLTPMGGKIPQGVSQKMLYSAAKGLATRFVESNAVLAAAIKAGFKPSQELAVKGFNDFLKKAPSFQVEQIKKSLAKRGLTIEKFIGQKKTKKEFQEQMAINAFFENKVLNNKSKVTDKDAKAYYDANPKFFKIPGDPKDSMRASHILIMVKEKADAKTKAAAKAKIDKILALLKKDASLFGELAEKESEGPSSKNKGSLGAFKKGQMVPEFEKAVVNLKTGEISAVVETKFGYHIIRRDALKGAQTKTFAEVKDKLKKFLEQKQNQEALAAFIKKITGNAKGKNYIK